MTDSQDRPIERTTTDLSDLGTGGSHRGAVERIDDKGISGWCLLASGPEVPVRLEIVLARRTIATAQTSRRRLDVSKAVPAAHSPGFEFYWLELTEAARQSFIAQLHELPAGTRPDIGVRVADREIELDASLAATAGLPTVESLARALHALATRPRTSSIASREALLQTLPPTTPPPATPRVRALAFYLPQFHPIPENDEWWGNGFTEWTNVAAAKPLFAGHDQPRLPSELGYYDLRTPGVIEKQIELAKSHGLAGFCFHHYWFGGQRLLQYPLERFLEIEHDLGFCICWANEPWSRRWDGSEHEVLMPQPHSLESDTRFIHDVLPLLQDRRYIRVDGKPILIVYRVSLFKEARTVFTRWREACVAAGLPGVHICMAETFGSRNPWDYGCDSAVEFPPHLTSARRLNDDPSAVEGLDPCFKGPIYEYAEAVANQLATSSPEYPRYPTVMLGWDNTSRRGALGTVFRGFTIGAFETWLEHACQTSEHEFSPDARLVFINAWNEWGEGTYLEPDRRFGRRCLESVRRVVLGTEPTQATLEVLRHRLGGDPSAIAALHRIQERMATLESSLGYVLRNARSKTAYATRTVLSQRAPAGCSPSMRGGLGALDQMGGRNSPHRHAVRRGEIVHLSGWAAPCDRPLSAHSSAYLQLSQRDGDTATYFGAILNRVKREDVVHSLVDGANAPSSTPTQVALLDRVRLAVRERGRKPPASPQENVRRLLTSADLLWSGFSTAFGTDTMTPGRYTLSILFPISGSGEPSAVEVRFEAALEIIE